MLSLSKNLRRVRASTTTNQLACLVRQSGFYSTTKSNHTTLSGENQLDQSEAITNVHLEKIVSLCKRRGFVFQSAEIYGGLNSTFDYAPLGAQMKKNIRDKWWKDFVQTRKDCMGIETPIIIHPDVWKAAGHVSTFVDPLVECKVCLKRLRADKMIEEMGDKHGLNKPVGQMTLEDMKKIIAENPPVCPCPKQSREFADPRMFNLLFTTHFGPITEGNQSVVYLRPETAQGIFVNFEKAMSTLRKRLPFGIGQIGRSFRNEISPRDFLFRTREFEQMELEYFCQPSEAEHWYNYWVKFCHEWLIGLGIKPENLRLRAYGKEESAHYADGTTDIEFKYPFGWGELWGIANRTDYDLKTHMEHSKKNLQYTDPVTGKKCIPYCIEPALGVDRLFMALLVDAYTEEEVPTAADSSDAAAGGAAGSPKMETRVVLKLHPSIAPFKYAVLPLLKKDELVKVAEEVYDALIMNASTEFDVSGTIGKRYRRHDEIGTPNCITIDFDTLKDRTVTVRDRDTLKQVRVKIDDLINMSKSGEVVRIPQ